MLTRAAQQNVSEPRRRLAFYGAGGIQDADPTSAITDLNQVATQQQAAPAAEKEMPRTSLFDYLA